MERFFLYAAVVIAALIVLRIFTLPIRWIFKLLLNTGVGFLGLLAVNWIGSYIGLALGINVWNALIIGTLGIPGLILLLLVRWFYLL